MFLNDAPGTLPAKPARSALGASPGWFNQDSSTAGTVLGAEWANMIQAELLAILAAAGINPDKAADNQLLLAIQALIKAGGIPPGIFAMYTGLAAPAGWIWAFGTVGSATSNATRANADTFAVFSLWFTDRDDTRCPLLTSGGVPVLRSTYANALAAWNANCQMSVPDYSERFVAGRSIGGSHGRITTANGSPDPSILGNTGGNERHNHSGQTGNANGLINAQGTSVQVAPVPHSHSISFDSSLPPFGFETPIIKL